MRVILANPPWKKDGLWGVRAGSRWPHIKSKEEGAYMPYPFFMGYATSLLKKSWHKSLLLDAIAEGLDDRTFIQRIVDFRPKLILVEISTPSLQSDMRYVQLIKENTKALVAVTGPAVGLGWEDFMKKYDSIDFVLKGEYEETLVELADAYEKKKNIGLIKGLIYRSGSKVIINDKRPLIKDIDTLPWPERGHLPLSRYLDAPGGMPTPCAQMIASRGCPYGCRFCAWPQLVYGGKNYRTRGIKDIVDEMEHLVKKMGAKSIYFDDDTFNIGKERMIDLAEEIRKRDLGVPWAIMARPDLMDEEILSALRNAGLHAVKYGVESGVQKLVDNCHKKLDLKKAEENILLTKKFGIKTHLTFTFGIPGETKKTIAGTINFNLRLDPDSVQFSIMTPFPGTELHKELKEQGMIVSDKDEDYDGNRKSVIKTETLSARDLEKARDIAYMKYNQQKEAQRKEHDRLMEREARDTQVKEASIRAEEKATRNKENRSKKLKGFIKGIKNIHKRLNPFDRSVDYDISDDIDIVEKDDTWKSGSKTAIKIREDEIKVDPEDDSNYSPDYEHDCNSCGDCGTDKSEKHHIETYDQLQMDMDKAPKAPGARKEPLIHDTSHDPSHDLSPNSGHNSGHDSNRESDDNYEYNDNKSDDLLENARPYVRELKNKVDSEPTKKDQEFLKNFSMGSPTRKMDSDIMILMCPQWGIDMPSLALGYLSAYLKKKGHKVLLFDMNIFLYHAMKGKEDGRNPWDWETKPVWVEKEYFDEMTAKMEKEFNKCVNLVVDSKIPVIGFSTIETNVLFSTELARRIKKKSPKTKIVFGGPGVFSQNLTEQIEDGIVDYYAIGEGEQSLHELIMAIKDGRSIENIKGITDKLVYKDGDLSYGIIEHKPVQLNKNLDDFPFPTYNEFNLGLYERPELPIFSSRGCVNHCCFCNDHRISGYYRTRSAEDLFNEIDYHFTIHKQKNFRFNDLLVNGNLKVLEEFCDKVIASGHDIIWTGQACIRSDMPKELFKKMKKAGCYTLVYGIETFSDGVLDKMKKRFESKDAAIVLKRTHDAGIVTMLNLIVGFPGETRKEHKETLDFIKKYSDYIDLVSRVSTCHLVANSDILVKAPEFGVVVPEGMDATYKWHSEDGKNTYDERKRRLKEVVKVLAKKKVDLLSTNLYEHNETTEEEFTEEKLGYNKNLENKIYHLPLLNEEISKHIKILTREYKRIMESDEAKGSISELKSINKAPKKKRSEDVKDYTNRRNDVLVNLRERLREMNEQQE